MSNLDSAIIWLADCALVTITSSTNYAPITFGEKYAVDKSWLDRSASNSALAPDNGFLFQNLNTPAAAVVAQKINGEVTPIYISPVLLAPSGPTGGDKLLPTPSVAVWFQMDVDTGTMVDEDVTDQYIIKMEGATARATFSKSGEWGS